MNDFVTKCTTTRNAVTASPAEVQFTLDLDMAVALGDFILEARSDNPAIVALGHQLQRITPSVSAMSSAVRANKRDGSTEAVLLTDNTGVGAKQSEANR